MFNSVPVSVYRDFVQGTWGSFVTPAGSVEYILTKARLGDESQEPERLLTKSLRPVREVMSADDLDFNQLLQRDLDDHRVATNLIEYLFKKRATGPALFPPIVAVLLPFKNKRPSSFPGLSTSPKYTQDVVSWAEWEADSAFQVRRMVDEEKKIHSVNLAQLRWNNTASQIVVMDGQHRAMALLAIDRTISRTWQDNEGAKYRSFYEEQISQYRKKYDPDGTLDLSKIEVPVMVCWFPEHTGVGSAPHEASRQLFVDVNKEAKPPSESRIILLSDAELINVLTRSLLSSLRATDSHDLVPLAAIEYDNPDVNASRPARWSVLTNINLLKIVVNRLVFGPARYLQQVDIKVVGREGAIERDVFMREQLDVESLFQSQIDDGGFTYERSGLGDKNFPLGKVDLIQGRFSSTWGLAILNLLSHVAPYRAHVGALKQLEVDWSASIDPAASLARDALFSGVGIYWTLKDSYEHFRDQLNAQTTPTRSASDDVINAWKLIEKKRSDFEVLRSSHYLSSGSPKKTAASKSAFDVMNTHACQLGLMLALGSLWEARKTRGDGADLADLPKFSNAMVESINIYLSGDKRKGSAKDRRLVLSRDVSNPINMITSMDTPRSVYFRHMWLQIMGTDESFAPLSDWLPKSELDKQIVKSRGLYFEYIMKEKASSLKSANPSLPATDVQKQARTATERDFARAMSEWFDITDADFSGFGENPVRSSDAVGPGHGTGEVDDGAEQVDDDASGEGEAPVGSLDELLSD